jgi:hypothetical protein
VAPDTAHVFGALTLGSAQSGKGDLLHSAFWLWLALTAIALTAVAVLWLLTGSIGRSVLGLSRKPRRRRIKDAWAEAGKRIEPLPHDDVQPEAESGDVAPQDDGTR